MLSDFSESTILYCIGIIASFLSTLGLYLSDNYNKDLKKMQEYYKIFFINVVIITLLLFTYFNFILKSINKQNNTLPNKVHTIDLSESSIQTGQPNF